MGGRERVLGGTPTSSDTQAGRVGGGQELLPPPRSALHRLCSLACCTPARQPPAVAVAVCFEKNTALSRGWCMPLTRGSAVCGAKRIAQHANPGLLSSPVRLSAFSQNVIKRNQA